MSTQSHRLDDGGAIDRSKTVSFSFDGQGYEGFKGDTVASALLANGRHMIARSFKFHRPRGIFAAGSEDPAAFVQVSADPAWTVPNVAATTQEIYDGLEAFSQNRWPSLRFDFGAVNDLLSPLFPAGFYNKTFMGPPLNWHFFEKFIRRAAGMGKAPRAPDPDKYESTHQHCEVLVIGGGPAGLMAALSAARTGARVILAEETARFGGRLLAAAPDALNLDGDKPQVWVNGMVSELKNREDVLLLTHTLGFGYYGDNYIGLVENLSDHLADAEKKAVHVRQRVWKIRAKQVVLATGAIERPLVFHKNDRPGIMLAGAVRTYLHRYGVLAGKNALIFTNNDSGWQTAFDLRAAGGQVAGIVDIRRDPGSGLTDRASALGIPVHPGAVVTNTTGRHRVAEADICLLDSAGNIKGPLNRMPCDLLAVSGGWSPNVALFSQSRGKLRYDEELAAYRPGQSWQAERSAGACNGTFGVAACLEEGATVGAAAAADAGLKAKPCTIPKIETSISENVRPAALWQAPSSRPARKTRAFVDLHNDVTVNDLKLAQREGYRSVEHTKRYTTTGMGTDQGKTANMNALGILSGISGKPVPEIGVTTFRQPYRPVTFSALAGQYSRDLFAPRRMTPMHDWHERNGAIFEPVGDWLRPWIYPEALESHHDALMRECEAARTSIGMVDATTLGKIDIKGKDAREFLNRVYTNAWMKLKPGRCRYGLMLGEDGMVMDDGVTSCLADDHFHMTTTTGGAARVLTWLEDYAQTEWPDLDVYMTSVTEQWAVMSLCGPNSAKLVDEVTDDLDPDPATFPFMSWRDAHIDGLPVRVFRISFTGELSYEINIPARYGLWLWEKLMEKGRQYGITPYGTEAMHLLRAEKGFIIVGQDTDGTITPHDLRMDWIVKKNTDFIGRRSLFRADTKRADRKQLVGLLTDDPQIVLEEGAHVIETKTEPAPPVPMLGHVTSSYMSPNLDRSIAMALVRSGGEHMGRTLYVSKQGAEPIPVKVTETDFIEMFKGGTDD